MYKNSINVTFLKLESCVGRKILVADVSGEIVMSHGMNFLVHGKLVTVTVREKWKRMSQ